MTTLETVCMVAEKALQGTTPKFLAPKYVAVNIYGVLCGFEAKPVFNTKSGLWSGLGIRLLGQIPKISLEEAKVMLFSVQEDIALPDSYILIRCHSEYATWKVTCLEQLRTEFMLATWNEEAFEAYCRQQWQIHEEVSAQPKEAQEDWVEPLYTSKRNTVEKSFSSITAR